jgi:hypothetical protein
MRTHQWRSLLAAALAAAAFAYSAPPAAAFTNLSYTFEQTGYAGDATVTGAFTGADLDGNGILVHFPSNGGPTPPIAFEELTAFSMHFSGNSLAPAFDLDLNQLFGFIYELGTAGIGDDPAFDPTVNQNLTEGIGAIGPLNFFTSGLGPNGFIGGYVGGEITNPGSIENSALDASENLVLVSLVPEPATAAFLLPGALAFAAMRRRPARAKVM